MCKNKFEQINADAIDCMTKHEQSLRQAHDQAVENLRGKGYRLTPQRLLVLSKVAEGGGHIGVDEVFRRAKEAHPYLDIATVYRTLHLFKKLDVVTEVAIGDRLHYELTDPRRASPPHGLPGLSQRLQLEPPSLGKVSPDTKAGVRLRA